jgi:hypothetical protein
MLLVHITNNYKQVSFLKNAFAGHENEYANFPISDSGIFLLYVNGIKTLNV